MFPVVLIIVVLAQPQAHDEPSLEWLVARSDLVVRASVAEVSKELLPKKPFPHDWAWIIVTLKMHETLKGRPPDTLQFAEHSLTYDKRYEGWKDAGRDLLVFLLRNPKYMPGGNEVEARFPFTPYAPPRGVLRLGPAVSQEKGWSPVPSVLFRSNLDILENPTDLVEAARRAVAVGRGAAGEISMHELSLPRRIMDWPGRGHDWNSLLVPVDSQLEILAREFIQSPADVFFKRGDSASKRAGERRLEEYWAGRRDAAKDEDERRRVQADRDRSDQRDRDDLRIGGVQALAHFKSDENIALLRSLLDDGSVAVVVAAAKAIGREQPKEAAAALLKRLKDGEPGAREAAARGLGAIGARESVPELLELLKDEDPAVRRCAVHVVGSELKAKEAAPALASLLKDQDASVRRLAVEGLRWTGSKADAPGLVKALHDGDDGVRINAVLAIGDLGAKEAAADLIGILGDPDIHVRRKAAWALGELGAREAAPALLKMLRAGGDYEDQATAARALGFLGAKEAIPPLMEHLNHGIPGIRMAASNALAELGATEAVEALRACLADMVPEARAEAASTLARLGSNAGVPILLEEARKRTPTARLMALNAIRQPNLYGKLKAKGLTRDIGGPPDEVAEAWRKDSSLPLVGVGRGAIRELRAHEGRTHLLRALEWIAGGWGSDAVLEHDRIRLLSPGEAFKFWAAWWEGEQKK